MANKEEFSIDVHETVNFTKAEKEKYFKAVEEVKKVLNTQRFKDRFLKEKLTSKLGYTNEEIYNLFMSGADKFSTEADRDLDVYVTMYYKNNNIIGYTYPSVNKTWINRKFFSEYDSADIAGNMVHEYLHKMKFGHSSASEKTSVPYAIGYLVEKCIREMWKSPELYKEYAAPAGKPPVIVEEPVKVPAPVEKPEELPATTQPPLVVEKPVEVQKLVCKRTWYTLFLGKTCWYE